MNPKPSPSNNISRPVSLYVKQISEVLDFGLHPLVQQQKSFVKDTGHILDLNENVKQEGNGVANLKSPKFSTYLGVKDIPSCFIL